MANLIKIKRGLKENLPILARGELGYATDTNELFIGILSEPSLVTDNILINDLSILEDYFTKSEIEDLAGNGLTWNSTTKKFDIDNPFDPSGTFENLRAQATTAEDVGLGNVTNESKEAMFTDPNFTGTVTGVTKDHVGLGNVENYKIATKEEAEAGTSTEKYMTPATTKDAILELSPPTDLTAVESHIDDSTIHFTQGDISITESQISDLQSYELADATILKSADIGVTVQAHDENTVIDANYETFDSSATYANLRAQATTAEDVGLGNVDNLKQIPLTQKGAANGVASLDSNSKVPLAQLPDTAKQQSYVVTNFSNLPTTNVLSGDKGYVTSTGDSYIWNGSSWLTLAEADWENVNLDYSNIINPPTTLSGTVNLTGNQTINGTKTFNNTITGSISGNAGTATSLETARTIGGVSFNGTSNINLPGVNTTGNQNTTGTAANVTGTVAIANGGTGAITAANARVNLGATDTGTSIFTISNPTTNNVGFFLSTTRTEPVPGNFSYSTIFRTPAQVRSDIGAAATSHTHVAGDITGGTFADARIPNLAASKITSGTFADARIPNLGTAKITSGRFVLDRLPTSGTANRFLKVGTANTTPTYAAIAAADVPNLDTGKITTGTLPLDRGGTGRTDGRSPRWITARTFTVGSTGKSVTGAANVSWSLAEIGAAATSHTHGAGAITSGTLALARGGTNRSDGRSTGVIETRASNSLQFWQGTQAQYNAIGTKNTNTIYLISS